MPFIPTVTSRESPIAGAPQSRASPEAFGAGVGRAMQQLGGAVQQFGASIATVGQKQAEEARRLRVQNAYTNADFNQTYFDNLSNAPADGTGLYQQQTETFDNWVNERVTSYLDEFPDDTKGADELRFKLQGLRPGVAGRAAADEFNMRNNASVLASKTGLDVQLNAIRTDPTQYAERVQAGLDLIEAQPGYDEAAKLAGRATFNSQAAVARFEAMIMAADPEDIPAIQEELGSEEWRNKFTAEHYEAVVKAVAQAETSKSEAIRSLLTAEITAAVDRVNAFDGNRDVLPDPSELGNLYERAAANGVSPSQLQTLRKAIVQNNEMQTALPNMSADQYRQRANSYTNAHFNQTEATPYLAQRLAKGKPAYYITNLDANFQTRLAALFQAGEAAGFGGFGIFSGARTAEDQERIIRQGGGPRPTVGSKYGSKHVHGQAVDIGYGGGSFGSMPRAAQEWLHRNAPAYGIAFPLKDGSLTGGRPEPWHAEMVEARGGTYNGPHGAGLSGPRTTGAVGETFKRTSGLYSLPPGMLEAQWFAESGGKTGPGIVSRAGARGPMQFMPGTWERYGKGGNIDDLDDAVDAAGRYMRDLMKRYNGNMELALMAYNWGEGNVDKYLKGERTPPDETRDYVRKVIGGMTSGDWQGAVAMPGTASVGPMTNEQFWAYEANNKAAAALDTILSKDAAEWGIRTVNSLGEDGSVTPLDMTPAGITPDAFAQRGEEMAILAQQQGLSPEQTKPFTTQEANALTQAMATGDTATSMHIMAAISGMDKRMQDYALKQLGQTDPVWAMAGRLYASGQTDIAFAGIEGRRLMKTAEGGTPAWLSGEDGANAVFDANKRAFAAFNPDDIGAIRGLVNAVYAYNTRFADTGDQLDDEAYQEAIAQVIGMEPDSVNGLDTYLPPDLDGGLVEDAMSVMSLADYIDMSVDNLPPVDNQGRPMDPAILEGATLHLYDGDDRLYQMAIDGARVAVRDPETGMAKPFILQLDPERIKGVLEDAGAERDPLTDEIISGGGGDNFIATREEGGRGTVEYMPGAGLVVRPTGAPEPTPPALSTPPEQLQTAPTRPYTGNFIERVLDGLTQTGRNQGMSEDQIRAIVEATRHQLTREETGQ